MRCHWFCWQKRRSKKAKEWPAETRGVGERSYTWHSPWVNVCVRPGEGYSSSLFFQSEVCLCALSLGRGKELFRGTERFRSGGVCFDQSSSFPVDTNRLSDKAGLNLNFWTRVWIEVYLSVFCFGFPSFPITTTFVEELIRKPKRMWIMWMIWLILWPLQQIDWIDKICCSLYTFIFLIQLILILLFFIFIFNLH